MQRRPIEKLLIANRGEIARRVIAACRRMGIATVAVHSDPDAEAPFVREADEVVALGGTTASDSYLRADALVAAAERTGADAVHPGYGFLAENAEFARAVAAAGLVWVGPAAESIEAMGSKIRARSIIERAGVPVLPGASLDGDAEAGSEAERIGFPLLVKASAGGGGKGMRAVSERAELDGAIAAARREAEGAFGDGTLFLERLLERPRHIEIQVLADGHGNTFSLGERECSIQRRHQKVIEEAPSPVVDPELRTRMGNAAVAAAEAVDYVGAGTVEFLLGPDREFYFLEMNTRLQVEHPVTEAVIGIDLVRAQLLVAMGEELPEELAAVEPDGHAIEVRLYAEDPANEYLPQSGSLVRFEAAADPASLTSFVPTGDERLRVDSGVETGSEVSPHYDPMLAKLIAWAPRRAEAAARLARSLARAEIHGPITNQDFLVRVLREPDFLAGETDTGFLDRHEGLAEPLASAEDERLHAAAAALIAEDAPGDGQLRFAPRGWRNNPAAPQRRAYRGREGDLEVAYAFDRNGLSLSVDGEALAEAAVTGLQRAGGEERGWVELAVAGIRRTFAVTRSAGISYVSGPLGHSALVELPRYPGEEEAAGAGALVAPMPGKVIRLAVTEGEDVAAGAVVAVLEAMKMEHELTAPASGTLTELRIAEGDQVDSGAILGVIDGEV